MTDMKRQSNLPQKIIVAILGLAINKNNQFLLTRRHAPGNSAWHNKWQIPGGGLEFGETPEQTLARELQEELSVSARIIHPHPIVKTSIWYGQETDQKSDSQIVLIAYLVDIDNQSVDISQDKETNQSSWFTFEQSMNLDSLPMTTEILVAAQKICNEYSLWSMVQ